MIDQQALPRPGRVEFADGTAFAASPWRDGAIVRTLVRDAQVNPRRLTLVYENSPAAVLKAVRDHWKAYADSDFAWQAPGDAFESRWIYPEPVSIDFNNAAGNARVVVEEALVHD